MIKNCNVIINGKSFYDQPIDFDTKRYNKTRKLTARQGKDYTRGYLLDYRYVKHYQRLIAVRIRCRSESNSVYRICWTIDK